MKKFILIAIFVSVVITSGAYYYFFIMMSKDESQVLPSKVKIAIKLPETPVAEKSSEKIKQKEEKHKEIPKAVIEKKQEAPKIENKSESTKKQEQKEEKPKKIETKVDDNETAKIQSKEPTKDVTSKVQRKIIGYRLEYYVGNDEEASKIKEELIGKGYHTAKKIYWGKKYYVVIAPFTDKWEAEYVKSDILKETNKNFTVKPVYR